MDVDFDDYIEKDRIRNDPQEKDYILCRRCGNEIYEGNEYFLFENTVLCEDCIDEILRDYKTESRKIVGEEDD